MRSIIKSWSCRNITPIGKIAVLKSLVLSKITHIIQSLPSPSEELIKIIEKMAYNLYGEQKGMRSVNKLYVKISKMEA